MNPIAPYIKTIPQNFLNEVQKNEKARRAFEKFKAEIALDLVPPEKVYPWLGGIYAGDWKNGKPEGFGRACYTTGQFYESTWKNGKNHGYGIYVDLSRDCEESFVGKFSEAKYESGTYTFGNTSTYSGHWMNNKKHGFGTSAYTDGVRETGIWEKGQLVQVAKDYKDSRD